MTSVNLGHATPLVPTNLVNMTGWAQAIGRQLNQAVSGKLNATATVTVAINVATTTLTDSRIGPNSFIALMPITADAASAIGSGCYITGQTNGSATINHANSSVNDRTYAVLIIG